MGTSIKKPDDLLFIEECFGRIKTKTNVRENLSKIERTLKRVFDIEFDISIVDNTTHKFFGMSIYPSVSTMDLIVSNIIEKKSSMSVVSELWQKNKKWHLEIDSILLYDRELNSNPAEITAILLHEIGHIVYSNTVPQRLNKVLRYKTMPLDHKVRSLMIVKKMRKLFNLAIIEACSSKNYNFINLKKERIADKFAIQFGYGDALNDFITKLITTRGNSLINRSEDELDRDLSSVVNWTVNNIRELEFRKGGLKDALRVEMLKSPSNMVRNIIGDIHASFFGDVEDKYRVLLAEQFMSVPRDLYSEMKAEQALVDDVNRILKEASLSIFDSVGKAKKVSQVDIDVLQVELDKIETNDDKIYILDRIYGHLDLVNASLDLIRLGKEKKVSQSKSTLTSMKDQLDRMREEVLVMKIVDKEYGVFIKYPKGYQG